MTEDELLQAEKLCPLMSEPPDKFVLCKDVDCAWWRESEYECEEDGSSCAILEIAWLMRRR